MKPENIFTLALIVVLFVIQAQQILKNRELQTQIDELKIIVNQRILPAMILDKESLMVR